MAQTVTGRCIDHWDGSTYDWEVYLWDGSTYEWEVYWSLGWLYLWLGSVFMGWLYLWMGGVFITGMVLLMNGRCIDHWDGSTYDWEVYLWDGSTYEWEVYLSLGWLYLLQGGLQWSLGGLHCNLSHAPLIIMIIDHSIAQRNMLLAMSWYVDFVTDDPSIDRLILLLIGGSLLPDCLDAKVVYQAL